jgi:septal ring factor EnvC (AmiA/AmiB activator)
MAILPRDLNTTQLVESVKKMAQSLEKKKQLTLIIEEKTVKLSELMASIKADQAELEELNKTADGFKELMADPEFSSSLLALASFIGEDNANN